MHVPLPPGSRPWLLPGCSSASISVTSHGVVYPCTALPIDCTSLQQQLYTQLFVSSTTRNIRHTRRHNKKQQISEGVDPALSTDEGQNSRDSTALQPTTESESAPSQEPVGGQAKKLAAGEMDIMDNTECKFNVNSFKMVYVVNSESYLYKRMALQHAKEVSAGRRTTRSKYFSEILNWNNIYTGIYSVDSYCKDLDVQEHRIWWYSVQAYIQAHVCSGYVWHYDSMHSYV